MKSHEETQKRNWLLEFGLLFYTRNRVVCSESRQKGVGSMGITDGLKLRKRALEALKKSTRMLEVAVTLMKQGNRTEAERVRGYARSQRTISTLLMAEANQLETSHQAAHYAEQRNDSRTNSISRY